MEQVAGLEPALNAWQALVLTTNTIPAYVKQHPAVLFTWPSIFILRTSLGIRRGCDPRLAAIPQFFWFFLPPRPCETSLTGTVGFCKSH